MYPVFFKKIKKYHKYYISTEGEIWGRDGLLKIHKDRNGYPVVSLWCNGLSKTFKVHALMKDNFPCHFMGMNGPCIDHKDRVKYNNKLENLRLCTMSQNCYNRGKHKKKSSIYKGVSYNKEHSKWGSKIKVGSKNYHLGYFKNEKAAACVYNIWAIYHFKYFANINRLEE